VLGLTCSDDFNAMSLVEESLHMND
jgi:hypothetical protein